MGYTILGYGIPYPKPLNPLISDKRILFLPRIMWAEEGCAADPGLRQRICCNPRYSLLKVIRSYSLNSLKGGYKV